MSDYTYFPIIKTRDSELRCFKNLSDEVFSKVMPIYELAKSRKTKVAPDGDIHKRLQAIKEIQENRPFILDLCIADAYRNSQIDQLLDEGDGFYQWRVFLLDVVRHLELNFIPMIHLYMDGGSEEIEIAKFVSEISKVKNRLAVRIPYDLDDDCICKFMEIITGALSEGGKIYVIFDAGYVRGKSINYVGNQFLVCCQLISDYSDYIEDVVVASASFPASPAVEGKNDADGVFSVTEYDIFSFVKNAGSKVKFGDYASINTAQVEIRAATFVPRIDVVTNNGSDFIYKRFRRDDGGYVRCAKEVVMDGRYVKINSWACGEIEKAATGNPTGISPSYWISVRMAYYIDYMVLNLLRLS